MALNKKRVFITLGISAVLASGAGLIYQFRFHGNEQSAALLASAERYLEEGKFDSARIELDKYLLTKPNDAQGHYLKGVATLEGRPVNKIRANDAQGIAAIRSFVQAVRKNDKLLDAHRQLLVYFSQAGNRDEAAIHADAILNLDNSDTDAHFAKGQALIAQRSAEQATPHLEFLLDRENPIRPRTVWLSIQVSELLGRQSDLAQRAMKKSQESPVSSKEANLEDQLAQIQIECWTAQHSNDAAKGSEQIRTAFSRLESLSRTASFEELAPAKLIATIEQSIPPEGNRPDQLKEIYHSLEPTREHLIEIVFQRAVQENFPDPSLFISYASRLRQKGKVDEAIKVAQQGLATSQSSTPEIRLAFSVCDLWLAEHFLFHHQADNAKPHLDALLANPQMRPYGLTLSAYQCVEDGDFETASTQLKEAITRLPDHGLAHALLGLCQLRRGFVTEGREYLQEGIRLGAKGPQYRAWLSLALAEAGYQDQAIRVAREVLEDPNSAMVGQVLLAQLRLRAGDLSRAASDLNTAAKNADPESLANIQMSQAEIAIAQKDWDNADRLLQSLKQTKLASKAMALEYRSLLVRDKKAEAEQYLKSARTKFPDDTLLLALEVNDLARTDRQQQAIDLLIEERKRQPEQTAPILMLVDLYNQTAASDKALTLLREACSLHADDVALELRLADQLLHTKNYEECNKVLASLKGDSRVNPTTLDYLLVRAASAQGDMATAEAIIRETALKDPDNPMVKFLLGQLAVKKGDFATAAEKLEQSLAGGMFRPQSTQLLFESLVRLGEWERVSSLLERSETAGMDIGILRGRLVRLLSQQNQTRLLEQELNRLLHDPSDKEFALAAGIFHNSGDYKRAWEILDQARAKFPDSTDLGRLEVALLLDQHQREKAVQRAEQLVAKHPKDGELYVLLAHTQFDQKSKLTAAQIDKILAIAEEGWKQVPGDPSIASLKARLLVLSDRRAEAEEFLKAAREQNPAVPEPDYVIARVAESLGKRDEALRRLEQLVVNSDKPDPRAAQHYLRMLVSRGDGDKLHRTVEQLLEKDPNNGIYLGILAEYHASRQDVEGLEAALTRLEKFQSTGPLVSYLRAIRAFSHGNYGEAEENLRRSLADRRGQLPSLFLMARIKMEQKKDAEAVQLIEQVMRQQPDFPSAAFLHAQLLVRLNRLSDAEAVCRKALEQEDQPEPFELLLARILADQKNPAHKAEILSIAEKQLRQEPISAMRMQVAINLMLDIGEVERAKSMIRDVAETSGKPELLVGAGQALFVAGEQDEALRLAEKALAADPNLSGARMLVAEGYAARGTKTNDPTYFEKAADQYREILKRDNGQITAANNLAWTVGIRLNKPERAMEELLSALPLATSPHSSLPVELLDTIGVLHLRMSHFDESRKFLEATIARDPSSAAGHHHLGELYEAENRPELARHHFDKAKSLAPNRHFDSESAFRSAAN